MFCEINIMYLALVSTQAFVCYGYWHSSDVGYGRDNDIATEVRRLYSEVRIARYLHFVCLVEFTKDCVMPVHRANNAIYPENQGLCLLLE